MKPPAPRAKRWDPRTPHEALILCDTLLAELTPHYSEAVERLADLQPGHSGRPVGTGEPGGGSMFSTTSVVERTAERTAEHGTPAEQRRLEHLTAYPNLLVATTRALITALHGRPPEIPTTSTAGQRLTWVAWIIRIAIDLHHAGVKIPHGPVHRLHDQVCKLHDLVFATVEPRQPTTPRSAELATDGTEMWCRSCLRIGQREPRSDRYDGLCRWCGNFLGSEAFLPTLTLLDAHHEGRRITETMINAERPRKRRKRK